MSVSQGNMTAGSSERLQLGDLGPRYFRLGVITAIVGVGLAILLGIFTLDSIDRFFRAYVFAFSTILAICLGGLFFTILQHLTRAGWSVTVRRIAEALAWNLTWIWILFVPILAAVWMSHIYHWMHPEGDMLLEHKAGYFFFPLHYDSQVPIFWLVRAVIFFAVWAMLARFFVNNSAAQDKSGDPAITSKMQWWAPLSMFAFAFTLSFASFDWIMSLEAHWFSTIFPVYFFAASACGFFATTIVVIYLLQRAGRIENEVTLEHYQDLGKLLFAFGVVFWAYIAFSQFMLLWYANIPETTGWYITRMSGGWAWVSLLLLVGHFGLPFLALLTKHTKRAKPILASIAGWLLVMHAVDMYWLVMPTMPESTLYEASTLAAFRAEATNEMLGFTPHLLDIALLVGLVGLLAAGTVQRLTKCSLIPERDPRLHEALAFENM